MGWSPSVIIREFRLCEKNGEKLKRKKLREKISFDLKPKMEDTVKQTESRLILKR